ncbi:ABC transporter permease [Iodobacter ciconiae]|uniref:ABC transporter permease n=1 Tax=Iodobacter ciconiae TaxID=2496266 RepID=A0A3S8ZRZ5_9NEIS|nr:ABC transporter permease [Iodobacter ciconiae]AZN36181.1 ABC transporter permease [Iodobacter ciconiae]
MNTLSPCKPVRLVSKGSFWLALGLISMVFLPLMPGLYRIGVDFVQASHWLAIWQDSQTKSALIATLTSTIMSGVLALGLALSISTEQYPLKAWQATVKRLPVLLAMPHAAFAIGFAFLFAPAGWLARAITPLAGWNTPPNWLTVQDPYGISLGIALAIKESFFLLWVIMNLLGERYIAQQITVARSMGYQRQQIWRSIILPQIGPRMIWPFMAVLAYSLSVVDMALILGPGTPPTFAVLTWQWLSDTDPQLQAQGNIASVILLITLLALGILLRVSWWLYQRFALNFTGIRQPNRISVMSRLYRLSVWMSFGLMGLIFIWSLAQSWFFPSLWPDALSIEAWMSADFIPFKTSLWLGLSSSFLALVMVLIWLEWGPRHSNAWLYAPLIFPVIPLAAAQYFTLLHLHLDGTAIGLIWSHLLWVLPYILLSLAGAYRQFDPRLMLTAQALGYSRWKTCLYIKWPLLMRPILAATALGFTVSIAQYLPTLFAGAGRYSTVTTEAIALSSSGNRRTMAIQSVLLMVLPFLAFGLAAMVSNWRAKHRRGLR